jgi:hypothetical protein
MPLTRYDPPGLLADFNAAQRDAWSRWMSDQIDAAREGYPDTTRHDAPRAQFFNLTKVNLAPDAVRQAITWTAFPRNVTITSVGDKQRWTRADESRDAQDEYCEWSVQRDPVTKKIVRLTFTCEGPEYWAFLAESTPNVALQLYRQFVDPAVQLSDLFSNDGRYRSRNPWNDSTTQGAMHLIQGSNTLGAEIELAGAATIVRELQGQKLTDAQALIKCGKYGDRRRHSDPHIGAEVNALARQRADITLENPVGIYFHELATAGWEAPDGAPGSDFWKIVRGEPGWGVRAVCEVPVGRPYVLGDVKIGGKPIEYGGQVADRITMKLVGVATRIGQSTVTPMTSCRENVPALAGAGLQADDAEAVLQVQPPRALGSRR